MKRTAGRDMLPFECEDALKALGCRISMARRAQQLTVADLAEMTKVSVGTITAIEQGQPTVQIGFVLNAAWALQILGDLLPHIERMGESLLTMSEADLPKRVRK